MPQEDGIPPGAGQPSRSQTSMFDVIVSAIAAAMANEVEQMAEAIYRENPVTQDDALLEWQEVIRTRPDRAAEFREAARNRIRAAEAMKRLTREPGGTP